MITFSLFVVNKWRKRCLTVNVTSSSICFHPSEVSSERCDAGHWARQCGSVRLSEGQRGQSQSHLSSLSPGFGVFLTVILWFDFDVPIRAWWIIVWFADNLWESSVFWWHSMQMGDIWVLQITTVGPLYICLPVRWVNWPISCVWRSHFWLEQSVNSKASPWLSPWLDELSLEKLLESLIYGLISPESMVITKSILPSSADGLKFIHILSVLTTSFSPTKVYKQFLNQPNQSTNKTGSAAGRCTSVVRVMLTPRWGEKTAWWLEIVFSNRGFGVFHLHCVTGWKQIELYVYISY